MLNRPDWRDALSSPWLVLLLGLLVAAAASLGLRHSAQREAAAHFALQADQLGALIEHRLHLPLYGLRGAASVISASGRANPATVQAYVASRDLRAEFPGVLGFGYVERVARADLPDYLQARRAADAPAFELRELDPGDRATLYIESIIEPAGPNAAALGLDLGSETKRRLAVEQAIASGQAVLSAPITLVQAQQQGPGFLLALPLFRPGRPVADAAQRRAALQGILIATLVAQDLLGGVAGAQDEQLQFLLTDASEASTDAVPWFSSQGSGASAPAAAGRQWLRRTVQAPGRTLELQVRSTAAFDTVALAWVPLGVFSSGALAASLLAALMWQQRQVRRQAETLAQRMSEEAQRLALVARNTSDVVVITDVSRRITWVNAAFERLTGYGAAEALGRSPGELLQFDGSDPTTIQRMRSALDAGQGFDGVILNRAKNGRLYWLALEIQAIRESDGQLSGFMAIERDITEQRLADAELRASQAFLDKAGRIGGVGGWAYDFASGQMHWSDQTCRLLEVDVGHQATLPEFLALCAPEARGQIEAILAEPSETTQSWDLELPMTTARGRQIWARAVAEGEYADGGMVRVIGALQDITTQREMQAEVTRSAELLRSAIDALDEGFVLFDAEDRLVLFNDQYRDTHTRSAELIQVGTRFEDLIRAGAQRGEYKAAIGRVEEWVAERLALHRAGNTAVVQHLANGRVLRVVDRRMPDGHRVGFRVDITDLVQAREAAEQASRTKSEFIATVSHELRTPLQSVLGFSELGVHFAEGQPRFQQMFTDIHAGGQRMLTLVNDLLDISKITGKAGSLSLRPADLNQQVQAVVRELQPLMAARQLHLDALPPALVLPAMLDSFRMQQVLRNVLANAIRFAPDGSRIHLSSRELGADGLELCIRDHGPGIPEAELEQVFEPFVQSSRTRDGSGGTGLGLAICRKIMSAHGGRIEAQVAPGGGALIRLQLPAMPGSPAAPAAETGPAAMPAAESVTTTAATTADPLPEHSPA